MSVAYLNTAALSNTTRMRLFECFTLPSIFRRPSTGPVNNPTVNQPSCCTLSDTVSAPFTVCPITSSACGR